MLEINNLNTEHLKIEHWKIKPKECWVILGRNGSGKRQLGEYINSSSCHRFQKVRMLSFEQQQIFYENELKIDDTDFMDHLDPGTTVREILALQNDLPSELSFLHLDKILDRGYRLLSSGESRKVLLAQIVLQEPDFLILDEPYDSLDQQSKQDLNDFFFQLIQNGKCQLLFFLNTFEEISSWHTHLAVIESGSMIAQGICQQVMANQELRALLTFDPLLLPPWPENISSSPLIEEMVNLKEGKVSYGEVSIFSNINLVIKKGEHTLITGKNGSGKSTLINLITGDHPQCYGNQLSVLGFKRGTGESIWQLKKQIGIVSPDLHRNHRVPGSALEIVLSGFFDSIGLYQAPSPPQTNHAKQWLKLVGLHSQSNTAFKQLSYGEQRLVLIARALVKQPALLILDEPTQGLDDINRHRVMYFIKHLSSQKRTTVIMASHRLDERLSLFVNHLAL